MVRRATKWLVTLLAASALVVGIAPWSSAEPAPAPTKLLDIRFDGSCVMSAPTADIRTDPDLTDFNGERFDWTLSGPTGETTGRVPWFVEDGEGSYGPVDFSLAPGHYRLSITRYATGTVVADRPFDVMRCVTLVQTCHATTFSNPVGNPAVRVRVTGDGGGYTVPVAPGASTTTRTLFAEISWSAYSAAYGDASPSAGEDWDLSMDQHCGPTQTRGVVGCAKGRTGVVRAWFSPPDNRRLSYRVDHHWDAVRRGQPGRDRYVKIRLPVRSWYSLFAFTATSRVEYDRVSYFRVVRCVTAKRVGTKVRFRNPSGPTVQVTYRVAGSAADRVVSIKPGRSATVRVGSGKVRWRTSSLQPVSLWRIDRGRGVVRAR